MFTTNDVNLADKICDPKIQVHNLLTSDQTDGVEAWKKSLAGIFKGEYALNTPMLLLLCDSCVASPSFY